MWPDVFFSFFFFFATWWFCIVLAFTSWLFRLFIFMVLDTSTYICYWTIIIIVVVVCVGNISYNAYYCQSHCTRLWLICIKNIQDQNLGSVFHSLGVTIYTFNTWCYNSINMYKILAIMNSDGFSFNDKPINASLGNFGVCLHRSAWKGSLRPSNK